MAGIGVDALDKINGLRDDVNDEYISFPQFVICGQSSAKKAFLKALLGVEFHREDGQDIAFITEVRSRKSDDPFKASLSVKSGSGTTQGARKYLPSSGSLEATFDTWPTVLKAFKRELPTQKPSKRCGITVRLDVWGPDLFNFDFIDVPAAYDSDDDLVIHLILSRLSARRSILMAVFSDKQDSSGEMIMSLLEQIDARRTFFILGCASLPIGLQVTHLEKWDLANIHQGWRLAQKSNGISSRADASVAAHLPPRGPAFCRLEDMIDSCNYFWSWNMQSMLPEILEEVQNEQRVCDMEIARLGPIRTTSKEKRHFLLRVHAKFKLLVGEGVQGQYHHDFFQGSESRRLRNMIRKLSDEFALAMQEHGHTYHVTDMISVDRDPLTFLGDSQTSPSSFITGASYIELIHDTVLSLNKSYELPGCHNPLHIGPLFRLHSANWRLFATVYAEKAFLIVERFLCDALNETTGYTNAYGIWKAFIKRNLEERKETLAIKIEELLLPFTEFELWARPARFERRLQRWKSKAENVQLPSGASNGKDPKALQSCLELLVNMLTYYMGAIETFINNMVSLAVEGCLLQDLSGVLKLEQILASDEGQLEKCASESPHSSLMRENIQQKRDKLGHAHGVLQEVAEEEAFSSFDLIASDIEQRYPSAAVECNFDAVSLRAFTEWRIGSDQIQYELRQPTFDEVAGQVDKRAATALHVDRSACRRLQFSGLPADLSDLTSIRSSFPQRADLHNSLSLTRRSKARPLRRSVRSSSLVSTGPPKEPEGSIQTSLAIRPVPAPASTTESEAANTNSLKTNESNLSAEERRAVPDFKISGVSPVPTTSFGFSNLYSSTNPANLFPPHTTNQNSTIAAAAYSCSHSATLLADPDAPPVSPAEVGSSTSPTITHTLPIVKPPSSIIADAPSRTTPPIPVFSGFQDFVATAKGSTSPVLPQTPFYTNTSSSAAAACSASTAVSQTSLPTHPPISAATATTSTSPFARWIPTPRKHKCAIIAGCCWNNPIIIL